MPPPGQARGILVQRLRLPIAQATNRLLSRFFRILWPNLKIVTGASFVSKLGLGQAYGLANARGQIPAAEARAIVWTS